ncbi:MAG: hypothetical protein HY897_05755 [Deltaproteobacteria bacterium]|nr:hypothetical protein [Deltaproteobacteria bacterium]
MRIKAIETVAMPGYPRIQLIVDNPDLLRRYPLDAWRRSAVVAGALAVFALGGCKSKVPADVVPTAEAGQKQPDGGSSGAGEATRRSVRDLDTFGGTVEFKPVKVKAMKDAIAKIAPLFVHGDGQGSTGCIVTAPPIFMSEDTARDIIINEMKKAGVEFDRSDVDMADEGLYVKNDGPVKDLSLDNYSTKSRLGFEFVSIEDFGGFGGRRSRSSVQSYDLKQCAENARTALKDFGKVPVAVFYDPVEKGSNRHRDRDGWKDAEKAARKKSEEELVAQVRDFIAWAKTEGVLK